MLNWKKYPPKYVISLAHRFAHGWELPAGAFNAVEAKNFFLRNGYKVVDRRAKSRKIIGPQDDESAFPEGRELCKKHRYLERDDAITKKAKRKRLAEVGKLQCNVCRFDFESKYGLRGSGFIEAHHRIPIAKLGGKSKTKVRDIALVCSNCHRMLHRGDPLLSVLLLRRVVHG